MRHRLKKEISLISPPCAIIFLAFQTPAACASIMPEWVRLDAGKCGGIYGPAVVPPPILPLITIMMDEVVIPDGKEIIEFLNSLSTSTNLDESLDAFRWELCKMLGDVDQVVPTIIHNARFWEQENSSISSFVMEVARPEDPGYETVSIGQRDAETPPHVLLIESMRRAKVDLDQFWPPPGFDYYASGGVCVGAILLFRKKERPAISRKTIALMEYLRPFIVFMITDLISRYNYGKPSTGVFADTILKVQEEAGLTDREFDVLQGLMFGLSYKEIAEKLHVTEVAIKKRVASIYRKTNVTSYTQIFARYFTGYISPDTVMNPDPYAEGMKNR